MKDKTSNLRVRYHHLLALRKLSEKEGKTMIQLIGDLIEEGWIDRGYKESSLNRIYRNAY